MTDEMANQKKDLVQIIRDNPGCVAEIDNDSWQLRKEVPEGFVDLHWTKQERWYDENQLACSDDKFDPPLGDGGYGSGNCYGGDILQALAKIVGIKVESV